MLDVRRTVTAPGWLAQRSNPGTPQVLHHGALHSGCHSPPLAEAATRPRARCTRPQSGYTMDSSTWQGNVVGVARRGSLAVTVQLRPGGYISPGDIARFTASDREGALVSYL